MNERSFNGRIVTAKEAAEKWGVSLRSVQGLCAEGRIEGATKMASIEQAGFDGSLVDKAIDNTRDGTSLSSLDATLLRDMAKELDSRGMHDEANAISHLRCPNEDALKDYEKTFGEDGKETNSESVYTGADIVNREQLERTEALLDKTELTREELQEYLNVNCNRDFNKDIRDSFKDTGIIPSGRDVQIP